MVIALAGIALLVLLVAAVIHGEKLPEGPEAVAWDREACTHCHMHVGEPAFAAQLQTQDGRVENFDDPGCLLQYLDAERPEIHALWFHHLREDRWIRGDRVAFVEASPTPMGHGLGAVDGNAPGAISLEQAMARVRAEEGR